MVETRMDAMISRAASQASQARTVAPRPAGERPLRPQKEQILEARPVKDAKAIETDIARIFAKRAFQATMVNENRTVAPKEGPRGGRLDIRA